MGSMFQNNPYNVAPSHKTDLDLYECFWKKKTSSYNQRKTLTLLIFSAEG